MTWQEFSYGVAAPQQEGRCWINRTKYVMPVRVAEDLYDRTFSYLMRRVPSMLVNDGKDQVFLSRDGAVITVEDVKGTVLQRTP